MLGRYRLEDLLGRGGMAEVYRAIDTRLTRTVAVKVILASHAADPRFSERFLREARLIASLEHPHVLPVYDFGEEDGVAYLVTPYLDGGSLRDRMLGSPIPFGEGVEWIRQLSDALDAAHAAGILHRDVKPANVLIGKGERLVLADFGIARMLEADTSLTGTGVVLGTPIYMSPEQAQGHPATAASDLYALAVLSWEILTGHPPFQGESAFALMNQHVTAPVPMISGRLPGLPAGLDPVFARALSKRPDDRPASCRLFADEVARQSQDIGGAHPASGDVPALPSAARATGPMVGNATGETVSILPASLPASGSRSPALRIAVGAFVAVAAIAGALTFSRGRPASSPSAGPLPATASPSPKPARTPEPAASPSVAASPPQVVELRPTAAVSGPAITPLPSMPPTASAKVVATAAPSVLIPPPPTSPPAPGEPAELLASARQRLERAFRGAGHLGRDDFASAREAAKRAAALDSSSPVARAIAIYAQGGLDYLDRKDAQAGQAIVDAFRTAPKSAIAELRPLRAALRGQDGTIGAPTGWELALAYGDARGEAEALLEGAFRQNPEGVRPLLGRAGLRRIQGRDDEALADALKAWEKRRPGVGGAGIAEFLGETYARRKDYPEAVRWLRLATTPPNALTGHSALMAARILREKLDRPDEAAALFRVACAAGVARACEETSPRPGGGRRRPRN